MRPSHPIRSLAAAVIVLLLGVGVYLNALHNPYVYDDYRTILSNGSLLNLNDWRAIVWFDLPRPIANLSFALDYALWGGEPFGFHLTSVLLHALNSLLFFLFVVHAASDSAADRTRGAQATLVAFAAAALFAVHPLMTEAVSYISSRSDVLSTTFVLAAILSGRRWMIGGSGWWLALTWFLWLPGIATKETAALLPVILLAYDRLVLDGDTLQRRRRLRLHVPLIVTAIIGGGLRLWLFVAGEHGGTPRIGWQAAVAQVDVARQYLMLLLVPSGQAVFHDSPLATTSVAAVAIRGLLFLVVSIAAAWWLRRRAPVATFGIVWFATFLAPAAVIGVLDTGDAMAEHRVYLASLGFFLIAGISADRIFDRPMLTARLRWLLAVAFVALLLSLGGRTMLRNTIWSDPISLWKEATEQAPRAWIPRAALGESLYQAGRREDAIALYREAVTLAPREERLYLQLATTLSELGRFDEARSALAELQQRMPESRIAQTGLGMVALLSGNIDDARARFGRVLAAAPGDVLTLRWMSVLEEHYAANPSAAAAWCREVKKWLPSDLSSDECIARNDARARTAAPRQ